MQVLRSVQQNLHRRPRARKDVNYRTVDNPKPTEHDVQPHPALDTLPPDEVVMRVAVYKPDAPSKKLQAGPELCAGPSPCLDAQCSLDTPDPSCSKGWLCMHACRRSLLRACSRPTLMQSARAQAHAHPMQSHLYAHACMPLPLQDPLNIKHKPARNACLHLRRPMPSQGTPAGGTGVCSAGEPDPRCPA